MLTQSDKDFYTQYWKNRIDFFMNKIENRKARKRTEYQNLLYDPAYDTHLMELYQKCDEAVSRLKALDAAF